MNIKVNNITDSYGKICDKTVGDSILLNIDFNDKVRGEQNSFYLDYSASQEILTIGETICFPDKTKPEKLFLHIDSMDKDNITSFVEELRTWCDNLEQIINVK